MANKFWRIRLTTIDPPSPALPAQSGNVSNRLNRLQLSLQSLFALTLIVAFLARIPARFGSGVLVIIGYFAVASAIVSLLVACAVALVDLAISAASRNRPSWAVARMQFGSCVLTGVLMGLAIQAIAIACIFSIVSAETQLAVLNSWTTGLEVLSQLIRGSQVEHIVALSPALLGAFSASVACAFANRTATAAQSIAPTGCFLSIMFGLGPLALLILWITIWNLFFRPAGPRPPPPPGHGNMLGLLPLAILMWCAMGAIFGGILGVTAAAALTLLDYARRNGVFRKRLWIVAILVIFLISEAAINGWLGKVYQW